MSTVQITWPVDGDILNRHDGIETTDAIKVVVRGVAPNGSELRVNGVIATQEGQNFRAEIPLSEHTNRIVAEAAGDRHAIQVLWNRSSRKRFRLSCDDNILFLKDLGLGPDRYPDLFDHWYLAFWRAMHREFGVKIHLNIYYQTDDFDLTQMPDKWRDTWEANAAWLHLSFHALQDKPDRPYRNARYAQIAHDHDLVCSHIRRFAGNVILPGVTTLHWAESPADGVEALRDRGVDVLVGLLTPDGGGTTGYYLTLEQNAHCYDRGAWHDNEMGVTFVHADMVVNAFGVEQIVPRLETRVAERPRDILELLIHEQYFRQELSLYQPTVMDKVRTALRWATQHGYEPVFWGDGFLGTQSC